MRELVRPVSAGLFEDMLARFGDDMRAAVRTGASTKKAVYTALDDVEKARFRADARTDMVTAGRLRGRGRGHDAAGSIVAVARGAGTPPELGMFRVLAVSNPKGPALARCLV